MRFLAAKFIQIPSGKKLVFRPAEIREPIMYLCERELSGCLSWNTLAVLLPWDTLLEAHPTVGLRLNCALTVCLRVSSLPSAAGGEIFDHCVSDELLPETQITRLIRQTLEGVHQLHHNNLVHLDLKVCAHRRTQTEPSLFTANNPFIQGPHVLFRDPYDASF